MLKRLSNLNRGFNPKSFLCNVMNSAFWLVLCGVAIYNIHIFFLIFIFRYRNFSSWQLTLSDFFFTLMSKGSPEQWVSSTHHRYHQHDIPENHHSNLRRTSLLFGSEQRCYLLHGKIITWYHSWSLSKKIITSISVAATDESRVIAVTTAWNKVIIWSLVELEKLGVAHWNINIRTYVTRLRKANDTEFHWKL